MMNSGSRARNGIVLRIWTGPLNSCSRKRVSPAIVPATPPPAVTIDLCNVRHVLEFEIPLVQIQLTWHLVTRKKNIREAIIIKVADTYAAAVIHIREIERVDGIVLDDTIVEMYVGMIGRDEFKQGFASLT